MIRPDSRTPNVVTDRRDLPSISSLLADDELRASTRLTEPILTEVLRQTVAREREAIERGSPPPSEGIRVRILRELERIERPRLDRVLNATGVIIHTNLGRAPVSRATAEAMAATASGTVALEIEPETGRRGGRMSEISSLMRLLTGAESTLVVNNNAAAVLLVLSALAAGREVVLARGEAVEIGGGFRIPDVLKESGARLVEVGTTNRTYSRDYADAVTADTAVFLKVHPSNFKVTGFVHAASIAELAPLAARHDVVLVEDLGSGALLDTAAYGLVREPTIADSLGAGAAVVTASGDKLLGGPQAGIIGGKAELIERIERHPLARAVRADKTCLAGLAATLRHYARGEAVSEIPVWRCISAPSDRLLARAHELRARLATTGLIVDTVETQATVGGGSLPGATLPSHAVALQHEGDDLPSWADTFARKLRTGRPGVYGRIDDHRVLLDLRTVMPEDDDALALAVCAAASMGNGEA